MRSFVVLLAASATACAPAAVAAAAPSAAPAGSAALPLPAADPAGLSGTGGSAVPSGSAPDLGDVLPGLLHAPSAAGKAPHYTGMAFDTCSAPSLAAMRAWWGHSPYKAVGIYFGGNNRACKQPNLSRTWVKKVRAMGWKLLPVYLGSQAPCVGNKGKKHRIDPHHAARQGRSEGADAARKAEGLGLGDPAPLYLDMESYKKNDASCSTAVRSYYSAWNRAVRGRGHVAGYYSSADSGIADLVRARRSGKAKRADLPDVVWYARWDNRATTTGERALPAAYWRNARIHQYRGNIKQRHHGVTMNIDVNKVDAPVVS